ncbi:hypothetical protein [Cardinium endosymbiont of Culicoides punctatus]|uniref:hypothetical protein n=1 Tax=Cardinium endosymbiont of Culicoides punctatus TaxID=2304601 RepID=UPI0010E33082|nr:hypothetical protein [Cardinium endosymbiont of Culicoides punctatus]TDG95180.1 hypothetical protein CCPUN_06010 [Cardinium endosymbiont of Culicoides punctatus]
MNHSMISISSRHFLLFTYFLCFLGLFACEKPKDTATSIYHPIWSELNDDEKDLPKDRCIFTKFGFERLRFHVTDGQQCFNTNESTFSKSEKNIIEIGKEITKWVVTPKFYGSVTSEKFPRTMQLGIKHKYGGKKHGLPATFLEELLAIENAKDAIVILSTGRQGLLGISKELENMLQEKRKKGEIENYLICNSTKAIKEHNDYVKQGKKVFTFICTNS